MSQLYRLRNGSIGHLDDAYKEEVIMELEFLNPRDLIAIIKQLEATKDDFISTENLLEDATAILRQGQKLTAHKLNEAMQLIADAVYSKPNESRGLIRETISQKAKERGYVDKGELDEEDEKGEM